MTTDRTVKMTYRGEWVMFRIEETSGYLYQATAYRELAWWTEPLAVSEWFETPGMAVASLVAEVMDDVDFVHAEMEFESDRDGMATYG